MTMVLGVQIIGIFFSLVMIYLTFLHRKRNEFSLKEFLAWGIAWIAFLFLTLFPKSIDLVVSRVGFARTLDAYIVMGFIFLIGIMFYIYSIVRINQNRIEEVVRKIALEKKK